MKGFNSNPAKKNRIVLSEPENYIDKACPECNGASEFQGRMGKKVWFKCTYCGIWYYTEQE